MALLIVLSDNANIEKYQDTPGAELGAAGSVGANATTSVLCRPPPHHSILFGLWSQVQSPVIILQRMKFDSVSMFP